VGGYEALDIAVRYLSIMMFFIVVLYLIHIFRNALQAIGIAVWSLLSGIAECACRIFMAKVAIHWAFLGSDALFVSEPVAWTGALLCVVIPYFYYRKKRLTPHQPIENSKKAFQEVSDENNQI
jgi:Na+-driven multidrug efflux pump